MMRKYKYIVNEDYFKKIDSHEKSYFLGYIFADGCVRITKRKNTDSYNFKLNLHKKDEAVIHKLREVLSSDYPVKYWKNMCSINICNKKFVQNLINIGCVPRKTKILKYPTIEHEFNNSFILGYFDGDGSISLTKKWFNFGLLGTNEFLKDTKTILNENNITTSDIQKYQGMGDVSQLVIYNKESIINLREYFYRDPIFCLERKKNIFYKINYIIGKKPIYSIEDSIIVNNYNKIPLSKIATLTNSTISTIHRKVVKLRKLGIIIDESVFRK